MASLVRNYARQRPGEDASAPSFGAVAAGGRRDNGVRDGGGGGGVGNAGGINQQHGFEQGRPIMLGPTEASPFIGDKCPDPGDAQQVLCNKLAFTPLFAHKPAHSDFLMMRKKPFLSSRHFGL